MAGYDEAGVGGIEFFVGVAGQLTVNSDIVDNPSLIAASGVPGGKVDGGNARKMAEQIGPDTSYRDVVVQLGVESQTITRRTQMQQTITDQLDAERESVSGVNIDEEMTNRWPSSTPTSPPPASSPPFTSCLTTLSSLFKPFP